jgi:arylsulfatase A-like enzyme
MKISTTPMWYVPALAVSVALAVGMLEVPAALLRRDLFAVPINSNGHMLWMAGLANLFVFLPIAVLLWVANRFWPGEHTERLAAIVFFTLGAFGLLKYLPRVGNLAFLLVALGIGVRGSAIVMGRREAFHTGIRRLALTLPIILLVCAAVAFAWTPLRERWMRRNLPAASAQAPNVLLLVLDTVRALRLSLYGYDRATSPALERWARSSTVFEQALATSSWTLPSHAGMFTGRYPHELNAGFRTALDDRWPTLAEVLARRGYQTAGFSANKEYVSYQTGLTRGFARFEDFRVSPGQILLSSSLGRYLAWKRWFQRMTGYFNIYGRKDAARVSDDFLSWLNRGSTGRPFFAFINFYDAHDPYFAPPPFDRRFTSDTLPYRPPGWLMLKRAARELEAHEGTLAYLDLEVDRLLTELESRGLLENTLVIITSDHGEQFGEHDLMSHGNSLYHPVLDVPLILRLPGKVPPNLRVRAPVTLRDLPATVLDLVGVPATEIPGVSWAPLWHPDAAAPGTGSPLLSALSWPNGDIAYALRVGDYEYIDWFQKKEELYDLRRDPGETRNLVSETDTAITASYRALRDSIVGDIYRPPEMNRLQMWLTGSPGRTRPKRDRQGGDSD